MAVYLLAALNSITACHSPGQLMAGVARLSLLDLAPPSGHGDIFNLVLGRLRLQDLQVSYPLARCSLIMFKSCSCSFTCRPCC